MRAFMTILLGALGASASGAPPVPEGSVLLEPTDRAVEPLETIRIQTDWDSAGYVITPDFSGLDSGGGGNPAVQDVGGGAYHIVYTTGTMSGLPDSSGVAIQIRAVNPASGDTVIARNLAVCRRTTLRLPEHVSTTIRGDQVVFRPADSLVVISLWRTHNAPGFRLEADYDSLVEGFQPSTARFTAVSADSSGVDTFKVAYRIPVSGIGQDRNGIPLRLVARDDLCSAIPSAEFMITLHLGEGPDPLEHRLVQPTGRGVRDGDTVVIWSRWDRGGYLLRPDFTELDGGLGGLPSVIDSSTVDPAAAGSYVIRYTPGPMSGFPDATVAIPITAVDSLDDAFTDRSLRVCRNLRTSPPIHEGTTFLDARTKVGPTDSLKIVTRWRSPAGLAITIEPDFRALAPSFEPGDARVDPIGADSFLVLYFTPQKDDLVSEREGIPLIIKARDELCSEVTYDSFLVELDTTAPEFHPTFDPLPAETNARTLRVGGLAPGATRVNVFLNNRLAAALDVDDADRFGVTLELEPGVNRINGTSLDEVGNSTPASPSQLVRYVAERTTVYSTPFRPGDEISVQDAAGLREAVVSIYNLEGDMLARFEDRSVVYEAHFVWNGRDRDGDLAQPGYYLMRVERTTTDGERHDEVLPLLFRNDQ